MTKEEIINALVMGEIDPEQSGFWTLSDDLYDLAHGFGSDYFWHGKMKAGTYFYAYIEDERIVEKYDWNLYGQCNPQDKLRRDAGYKDYVCLAFLHE